MVATFVVPGCKNPCSPRYLHADSLPAHKVPLYVSPKLQRAQPLAPWTLGTPMPTIWWGMHELARDYPAPKVKNGIFPRYLSSANALGPTQMARPMNKPGKTGQLRHTTLFGITLSEVRRQSMLVGGHFGGTGMQKSRTHYWHTKFRYMSHLARLHRAQPLAPWTLDTPMPTIWG